MHGLQTNVGWGLHTVLKGFSSPLGKAFATKHLLLDILPALKNIKHNTHQHKQIKFIFICRGVIYNSLL